MKEERLSKDAKKYLKENSGKTKKHRRKKPKKPFWLHKKSHQNPFP